MLLSIKQLWKKWRYGDTCMILAALAAQSANISVGLCQGYSAVMLPSLAIDRPDITEEQASWIASLGVISNPFGALIGGILVDAIGRKATLQSIVVPSLLGWVTMALSTTHLEMCIGRFITGFTIGMSTSTYIYAVEIATPELRGVLSAIGPALVSLGIFLVYVLGSYLHWKTVASICAAISLVTPVLLQGVPESPLWLASKGKIKKAYEAMYWLRQNNATAQREIDDFYKTHSGTQVDGIMDKLRSIWKWAVLRPFLILIAFFTFQELSGIYIILYYAVDFFKKVGTEVDAFTATMIVGALRVLVGVLGAFLINQVRRKVLVAISGTLLSVSMFVAPSVEYLGGGPTLKLVCILAHVCGSMIGFLQLPWIMSGELYPQKIRGLMSGITTSCAYVLIFLSIKTYPGLVQWLGFDGTLYSFACCSILGVLFCIAVLPETKGKSLSAIEKEFENDAVDANVEKSSEKQVPQVLTLGAGKENI